MPPPNLTPATAIVISPGPYTATINNEDPANDLWYRWDWADGDVEIGFFAYAAGGAVKTSVYTGTPSSLANFIQSNPWNSGTPNRPVQIPIPPDLATSIFIKVESASIVDIDISVVRGPAVDAPAGSILISDDTPGFPAIVLDGATGAALKFAYPFAAGEAGDGWADGKLLYYDLDLGLLALYNADLTLDTTIALNGGLIRAQFTLDRVYAMEDKASPILKSYNSSGVEQSSITLTGMARPRGFTVSNDGNTLYYAGTGNAEPVKRWDLAGNAPLSDLVAAASPYFIIDMLTLDDDTILVSYARSAFSIIDVLVQHYNAAGATLHTINFGSDNRFPSGTFPRMAYAVDTADQFVFWTHQTTPSGFSRVRRVVVSTGVVLDDFTRVEYEGGVYNAAETATPADDFGNSFSCPIVVLRSGIDAPVGTLIVEKITSPSGSVQDFDFESPGLTPSTFTLQDGGSQSFVDIPVGTYSIEEITPTGWTLTDVTVSNGSPADAITVGDGETVTVTFTNTENSPCPGTRGAAPIGA